MSEIDTTGRALVPCFKKCGGVERMQKDGECFLRCAKLGEGFKDQRTYRFTNPPEGCPFAEEHKKWHTPKTPVADPQWLVESSGKTYDHEDEAKDACQPGEWPRPVPTVNREITCPACGKKGIVKAVKGDKASYVCEDGCNGLFEVSPEGDVTRSPLRNSEYQRRGLHEFGRGMAKVPNLPNGEKGAMPECVNIPLWKVGQSIIVATLLLLSASALAQTNAPPAPKASTNVFGPCRWDPSVATNYPRIVPPPGKCESDYGALRSARK